MLLPSNVRLGNRNEEILPMDFVGFPYICKQDKTQNGETQSPWHWHNVFAINYIAQGSTCFYAPQMECVLQAGEAIFVNANVLHRHCCQGMEAFEMYSHVFDMRLLAGQYNSVFEEKYIRPIVRSKGLQLFAIRPETREKKQILSDLVRLMELAKDEPYGYELMIRSVLSDVWLQLLLQTQDIRTKQQSINPDEERIKAMMDYIHKNYAKALKLQEIADAANVSQREGARCFERSIKMSPMQYLTDYRLRRAERMLTETDHSVLQISELCGFSSSGYFARVFREAVGMSPREYRKQNQG